jgi:two-component system, chemotaxis family, CheB/CheR fusion protein
MTLESNGNETVESKPFEPKFPVFTQVEPQQQVYAKNPTAIQSAPAGIPSSDALPPLGERTVGSKSHLNNLANRQSSLGDLPEFDLLEKVERIQVANERMLWIEQELQHKYLELKDANEEIQAATEELRYRNAQQDRVNNDSIERERNEFVSNLSHELRNPLTAIIGWAQRLQTHQKLAPAIVTRGLEVIYRNAKLQSQSIDNMLDLAQLTRGKLHLNPIRLDLVPILSAAIASVQDSADTKSIQLVANLTPTMITGDVYRLEQVLWNLLTNAIKFTPSGGKVEVTLTTVENYAQIRVSDTGIGIGIGAKLLPHVFDTFRQGDASSSKTSPGLGVGLPLVRQLVELHGGNVRAESVGKGRGTTIVMQLFLEAVPSDAAAMGRSVTQVVSLLEGLHILAVDDEPHILGLVKYILEDAGAAVTTVTSTRDALSSLVTSGVKYDALLADIGMPDEDGLALIGRVRALAVEAGGQIPAAAITAYSSDRERQQAITSRRGYANDAGFQAHLAKPFYAEQLIQMVANLTGRVKVGLLHPILVVPN